MLGKYKLIDPKLLYLSLYIYLYGDQRKPE